MTETNTELLANEIKHIKDELTEFKKEFKECMKDIKSKLDNKYVSKIEHDALEKDYVEFRNNIRATVNKIIVGVIVTFLGAVLISYLK